MRGSPVVVPMAMVVAARNTIVFMLVFGPVVVPMTMFRSCLSVIVTARNAIVLMLVFGPVVVPMLGMIGARHT